MAAAQAGYCKVAYWVAATANAAASAAAAASVGNFTAAQSYSRSANSTAKATAAAVQTPLTPGKPSNTVPYHQGPRFDRGHISTLLVAFVQCLHVHLSAQRHAARSLAHWQCSQLVSHHYALMHSLPANAHHLGNLTVHARHAVRTLLLPA